MRCLCLTTTQLFKDDMTIANIFLSRLPDDSALNCRAAAALKWTAVHLVESDEPAPEQKASQFQIRTLYELPDCLPQFFKSRSGAKKHTGHSTNGTNGMT